MKSFIFWLIFIPLFYAFLVEPFFVSVTKWEINKGFEKEIKIVHISDLHMSFYFFYHDLIISKIKALKPDLILYSGDTLSNGSNKASLIKFFEKLTKVAPVYAIYGNWDYRDINLVNEVYNQTGVYVVNGNTLGVKIKGVTIKLVGLPLYYPIRNLDTSSASITIALEHFPTTIFRNSKLLFQMVDIVLGGHTHGGQVYIPYVSEVFLRPFLGRFWEYLRGKYKIGENKYLYVNRGLGSWLNLRFGSPPEILLIDLK